MWHANEFKSRNVMIDHRALFILEKFVEKPSYSAYQMCGILEKGPFKMKYKNVHRRFRILEKLNLIKRSGLTPSKRGAIYYKLTSEGIFCLLLNWHSAFIIFTGRSLFEHYGDDNIFHIFLYPYLSHETVKKLKGAAIIYLILEYLRECCREINCTLNKMGEGGTDLDTILPVVGQDKNMRILTVVGEKVDSIIRTKLLRLLIYDLLCFPKKESPSDKSILANDKSFVKLVEEMKKNFNTNYEKLISLKMA